MAKTSWKHSLLLKVAIIVVLGESLVLFGLGLYYITRFSEELDKALEVRIRLPGQLMNRQFLRYESVADGEVMTNLVGDEFVDGMIIGADGMVYYAYHPDNLGKRVTDIPGFDKSLLKDAEHSDKVQEFEEHGRDYLVCVSPITAYVDSAPFFFTYVKSSLAETQGKKRGLTTLFILGSVFCVVVTSFLIISLAKALITGPVSELEKSAKRLARGQLEQPIDTSRRDELGGLARSFANMRDAINEKMEELRQANQVLEQANERLRELDTMKSSFLSAVSHELRTPLTSLLGYAKLIKRNFIKRFVPLAGDPEQKKHAGRIVENLDIIEEEGERLTRLINSVLDLHKIESGRLEWRDAPVNPGELLERAVQVIRSRFEDLPDTSLTYHCGENLPNVFVDSDRIIQVLINLLDNAAKFTSRGMVSASVSQLDEGVLFSVRDTGAGIPHDELENIFNAFHQAGALEDKPRSVAYGTGLGLAICKEIVERHEGRIWAESSAHGSAFNFTLPAMELQ